MRPSSGRHASRKGSFTPKSPGTIRFWSEGQMKKNVALALIGQLLLPIGFVVLQGCAVPGGRFDRDLHELTLEAQHSGPPAGPADAFTPSAPDPRGAAAS